MAIPKKILIRIIGAPLLLILLGGILYLDYCDPYGGAPHKNLATRWLVAVVATLALIEFYTLCRLKGIETANVVGVVFMVFVAGLWPWLAQVSGLPGLVMRLDRIQYWAPVILAMYCLWKLAFRPGKFTVEALKED